MRSVPCRPTRRLSPSLIDHVGLLVRLAPAALLVPARRPAPTALLVSGTLLLLVSVAATPVSAAIYFVSPDGTGDFPTINAATTHPAVVNGDVIALTDGTFSGTGNYNIELLGKAITIHSESGDPETCIIDCGGVTGQRGFILVSSENPDTVIENITITNGNVDTGSAWGGAIYCNPASPTIHNCIFTNNTAQRGGAVAFISGFAEVSDCIFEGNFADDGGALYIADVSTPMLTGCTFSGNTAEGDGGAIHLYSATAFVENTTFVGNGAENGGAVWCEGSGAVFYGFDSQFLENEADFWGGALFVTLNAQAVLYTCTLAGNSSRFTGICARLVSSTLELHDCTLGDNSKELSTGSAISLTNTSSTVAENTIIAMNKGQAVECDGTSSATFTCCDVYGNADGDWIGCIAGQEGVDGNISEDPEFCGEFHPESPYTLQDTSPCAAENNPGCGQIGAWPIGCTIIHVEADGSGDEATIQAAADVAEDGDTVELGSGVYQGQGNRRVSTLGKAIVIRTQGRGRQGAIIDCQGTRRGFIIANGEGPNTVLLGLTIINGSGVNGGAVFCSTGTSPLIIDCTFSDNAADYGGGVCCAYDAAPTIRGCLFESNLATEGGGLYCGGLADPLVEECTFDADTAASGGAVFCDVGSSPRLTNCTLVRNRSSTGAGVAISLIALPIIENTIIAFSISGAAVSGSGATFSCSDLYGNAGGDWTGLIADQYGVDGNFSLGPQFCNLPQGDFHLWNSSPCNQVVCGLIGAWPIGCTNPQGIDPGGPADPGPESPLVTAFYLHPSGANPSRGATRLAFALPGAGTALPVRVRVFDPVGRLVRCLLDDRLPPGHYEASWDGTRIDGTPAGSGVYFVRLETGDRRLLTRVLVMR
ncbi:MAG: right-handed parallel beta-helix repeat-containing protein [Candidatus Eisenbacteria sp.]|nr:right-handed parallel beta-helix repeat-containing protein [Candidatus Eisenbacteria bacterium]